MEEKQEIVFARTLEKVRRQAKEQQGCISEQQVRDAFEELRLSEEQLGMVFDYLRQHKIGIDEPVDPDEYLSGEEINYLEEYKKQLLAMETVSDGEKEAVLLSAMAGESDGKDKVICLYLPQVVEISKLYAGQGVLLEDLIGEGNVALSMGAAMLGCAENAGEAEGLLVKMIMDAMEDCITENVKEQDKDRKILNRVNKVSAKAKELSEELHRKVTVEELAVETGMSEKAIRDAMRMSGYAIEELEGR